MTGQDGQSGGKAGKLFVTGYLPAVTYGAEVHGCTEAVARQLRVTHHKTSRRWIPGADAGMISVLQGPSRDPIAGVEFAPLGRWHREVWLSGDFSAPDDVLNEGELAQAFAVAVSLELSDPHSKKPPSSPVVAALRAAKLPSGPFGGSVAGISLSPGAEAFSLVGNVSALFAGGSGGAEGENEGGGRGIDETFVYPPPMAMA